MPTWAWVLCSLLALLGLLALVLALCRIRYYFEWRGILEPSDEHLLGNSEGSMRLSYGFPGLMRSWEPFKEKSWSLDSLADALLHDDDDVEDLAEKAEKEKIDSQVKSAVEPERKDFGGRKSSVDPEPVNRFSREQEPGLEKAPGKAEEKARAKLRKKQILRRKKRRALFRLVTDGRAWGYLTRYGARVSHMVLGLLKPRVEVAVGGFEPARLGRLAGKWYAVRPFLPLGDARLYLRFQDRHPSLWVKLEGGFSALSLLGFGVKLLVTFPSIPLAGRAFRSWQSHQLTGWRGWVYRKLQTRA